MDSGIIDSSTSNRVTRVNMEVYTSDSIPFRMPLWGLLALLALAIVVLIIIMSRVDRHTHRPDRVPAPQSIQSA